MTGGGSVTNPCGRECSSPHLCVDTGHCPLRAPAPPHVLTVPPPPQRRDWREVDRELREAFETRRTNMAEARIAELQKRTVLLPGEEIELEILLKRKWRVEA